MEIKKNSILQVLIDDMTVEGAGVGHIDGAAVFVDNSVVGDLLEIIIIKVAKNYFVGKIKRILKPSKMRIENDCPSFPQCGGCAFRNISYQPECEIKQKRVADCIKRIAKKDVIPNDLVGCENISEYRNKAQYKFSLDREGNIQIGFFARHSHRVVDAENCLLQPKEFSEIVDIVRNFATENNLSVYDETTGKGLLRQLYIRKGFATNEIMVCLVINGNHIINGEDLVKKLTQKVPKIVSVVININRDKTNVILGDECKTIYGKDTISDILCGVNFSLSPHSFYQVNPIQAEKLFKKAEEYADFKGGETVLDLYCGVGAVGLCAAKNADKLIGVEIIPQAVENAKQNALKNVIDNAEFICADATTAAEMLAKRGISPDVVMIDPPRKGCTPELISTVTEDMKPKRVVYISCDPATLARDIAIFEEKGYRLKEITPFDLFPRTPHVECVALLSRQINVHKMKLNSTPFEMIKSGEKTIELRLYDEKRQRIKVGDKIVFTDNTTGETLNSTVTKLHRFNTFNELYKSLPLLKCGYTTENIDKATPTDMGQYYSVEEQEKYGVVGIELCRPKEITDENVALLVRQ